MPEMVDTFTTGGGPGLCAPFPWFGGKSRVAPVVWERFGDVANYVEPFFGSGAVLLGAPAAADRVETVNDRDGFVANFWRALQAEPHAVAHWADWPVNENDQHARHAWLVEQRATLTAQLEGDPEYYDPKIAGWWVWGICCWIGSGWCSGEGPWVRKEGKLVHLASLGRGAGQGVRRQLVHLGAGRGVHRKGRPNEGLVAWMQALANRLRYVRVWCGDWARVCGPAPTVKQGVTAVFLDPPYSDEADRMANLYAVDCGHVAHAVRDWALTHGDDPRLRIALCGYAGEYDMPDRWRETRWNAHGGYALVGDGPGRENKRRERIWYSPHCLLPQPSLFGDEIRSDDSDDMCAD